MEKIKFRISSELKNIIGQDLITDDFVAIFELVKNSFDAGAKKVFVVFYFKSNNPSIHIIDNGKGMSQEDIKKKWFFLLLILNAKSFISDILIISDIAGRTVCGILKGAFLTVGLWIVPVWIAAV